MENPIDVAVKDLNEHRITRRTLLARGAVLGVSFSSLYSAIDHAAAQKIPMLGSHEFGAKDRAHFTRETLVKETEGLLDAISHPAFVNRMRQFNSLSNDVERFQYAGDALTTDALSKSGVNLPPGMRISSRTFEEANNKGLLPFVDYEEGKRIINFLREKKPEIFVQDLISWVDPRKPGINPRGHAVACSCSGGPLTCAGSGSSTGKSSLERVSPSPELPGPRVKSSLPLRLTMRQIYNELIDFALDPSFKVLIEDMYELPPEQRPRYVEEVLLQPNMLAHRGVTVPEGVLIQRSSFGDMRPTLFVIKKYLPKPLQFAWENVNITFDQNHKPYQVPDSWTTPLPFEVQSILSAHGITYKELKELGY
ncbi:hypothetical protein NKDENANG_03596 [Candidatus Entotheonellaceae bacterium PAL068K]